MTKPQENKCSFFFDLQKTYDSVPRFAMWLVLQKYGVPDVIVDLVRALHDNIKVKVFMAGEYVRIQVFKGLRQGCVLH